MELHLMETGDAGKCLAVVKAAFDNYVMFRDYVGYAKDGAVFFDAFMNSWWEGALESGIVLCAKEDEDILAVAVIQEPGAPEVEVIDPGTFEGARAWEAGGKENTEKLIQLCIEAETAIYTLREPAWYLSLLAVDPASQGKRIGSRLLKEGVEAYIASAGGGLFTLCTSDETNRGFYRANGFEEYDERMCDKGDGTTIGSWCFIKRIEATSGESGD